MSWADCWELLKRVEAERDVLREQRGRDRARIETLETALGQIKDICAEALDPMDVKLPYSSVKIILVLIEEASVLQ